MAVQAAIVVRAHLWGRKYDYRLLMVPLEGGRKIVEKENERSRQL